MVHGREGTERCLVYVSLIFGPFCMLFVGKINNMMLCVKIMFIHTCLTYYVRPRIK